MAAQGGSKLTHNELAAEYLDQVQGSLAASIIRLATGHHRLAIELLSNAESSIEESRREMVASWRAYGASWYDVGDALGISRQAAWKRYGPLGSL